MWKNERKVHVGQVFAPNTLNTRRKRIVVHERDYILPMNDLVSDDTFPSSRCETDAFLHVGKTVATRR